MALPAITGVCRIAVRGTTGHGTQWVNVHHVKKSSGTWDASAITAYVPHLEKLYGGPAYSAGNEWLLKRCHTSLKLVDYTFTPLDGSSASTVVNSALVGGDSTQQLPAEVAFVLSLRTGFRGRSYRGRLYLPQFCVDATDATGQLGSAIATSIIGQAQGYLTATNAAGYLWGVASYKYSYFNSITSVSMDLNADVQRRRKA